MSWLKYMKENKEFTFREKTLSCWETYLLRWIFMFSEDFTSFGLNVLFGSVLRLLRCLVGKLTWLPSVTCTVAATKSILALFWSLLTEEPSNTLPGFHCFDWAETWLVRLHLVEILFSSLAKAYSRCTEEMKERTWIKFPRRGKK